MVGEVVEMLSPRSSGQYFDGTVGGGGHASAILVASAPRGRLLACDRDGDAIEAAGRNLQEFGGRVALQRGNFSEIGRWLRPGSCDGAVLDLGVSSAQLDWAERGFSFQADGPLDMRQDRRQTLTAEALINEAAGEDLERWFRDYGGERYARRLARAVLRERSRVRLRTTRDLAELVERECVRGRRRIHPATGVFQALRIVVNEELDSLERGLRAVWEVLCCGGVLAVISFHSCEDRIVKNFGRQRERDYEFDGPVDRPEFRRPCPPRLRWIRRKPCVPSEKEVASNPRARSARLRGMQKLM